MLEDKLRKRIREIAEILRDFAPNQKLNIGLMSGRIGITLFFLHYAQFTKSEKYLDLSYQILEDIFERIPFHIGYYDFSRGFSGLGWLLEHCNSADLMEIDTNEIFGEYDNLLYQQMVTEMKRHHYDYIDGGLGIFLYFLNKPKSEANYQWLAHGIELVDELSVKENGLIRWYDYDFIHHKIKNNQYNLGLSHGIPGILAILVKAYEKGIHLERTTSLIRGAADYLVSLFDEKNRGQSVFPYYDTPGRELVKNARLAWCYGDLGVCIALHHANEILKDPLIAEVIRKTLGHSASRRDLNETLIKDAALCHGAAGAGHIFNHFYKQYNDPLHLDAAAYWFEVSLEMPLPDNPGLLEGFAGIGLAYMSYLNPEISGWDEALLIS